MAVNEQTGYQKSSLDNKQSNTVLRDITGQQLNPTEIKQLSDVFNTPIEVLAGLTEEIIIDRTLDETNPANTAAAPTEIETPAQQSNNEFTVGSAEPPVNALNTAIFLGDLGFVPSEFDEVPTEVAIEAMINIAAQTEQLDNDAEEEPDAAPYGSENDKHAFSALAIGSGAAGRVHRFLDANDQRGTLAGSGDENDNDPRTIQRRMMNEFIINNSITNLQNQIQQIDHRISEIDTRLGKIKIEIAAIDERLEEIEQETIALTEEKNVLETRNEEIIQNELPAAEAEHEKNQEASKAAAEKVEEEQEKIDELKVELKVDKEKLEQAKAQGNKTEETTAEHKVTDTQNKIDTQQVKLDQAKDNQRIADERTQTSGEKVASLKDELASNQTRIVEIDKHLGGLTQEKLDLMKNRTDLTNEETQLLNEKQELLDQKQGLEQQVKNQQTEINYNDLSAQTSGRYQGLVTGNESAVQTLENIQTLETENSGYYDQLTNWEFENGDFNTAYTTGLMNEEQQSVYTNYASNNSAIEDLNKQLTDTETEIANYETEIERLEAEISQLENTQQEAQEQVVKTQEALETATDAAQTAEQQSIEATDAAQTAEQNVMTDSNGNIVENMEENPWYSPNDYTVIDENGNKQEAGFIESFQIGFSRDSDSTTQQQVNTAEKNADQATNNAVQKDADKQTAANNNNNAQQNLTTTTEELEEKRQQLANTNAQQNNSDLALNTSRASAVSVTSNIKNAPEGSLASTYSHAGEARDTPLDVDTQTPQRRHTDMPSDPNEINKTAQLNMNT